MPCTDGGVPYPPSREEILDSKTPAMLCALIGALEKSDYLDALDRIDWKESGLTRNQFEEWWGIHQQRDEARRKREAEQKRIAALREEGLSKLTDAQKRALGLKE
jgi:hypothetical protein